jgi:hypothetical protein
VGVEIDSSTGNAHRIRKQAHSVLTRDLVDEPGHPPATPWTRSSTFPQAAVDRLIDRPRWWVVLGS